MESQLEILKQHLSEQIAIEEHLYRIIQDQISDIDEANFGDAKTLLVNTAVILENHFTPLNKLLDELEQDELEASILPISGNGHAPISVTVQEQKKRRISAILRDDYSALNGVTMSNTLLHTTALALDCRDVASTALKHLENLAPIVVKIGELVPLIAARELTIGAQIVDPSIAITALKNAQLVWRKASEDMA